MSLSFTIVLSPKSFQKNVDLKIPKYKGGSKQRMSFIGIPMGLPPIFQTINENLPMVRNKGNRINYIYKKNDDQYATANRRVLWVLS